MDLLYQQISSRERLGNYRSLELFENLIDFSSNDYLGLAKNEKMYDLFLEKCKQNCFCENKFGSTGSRLLSGNSEYARNLEKSIAEFHGYKAGLLFNCGYMANSGLISTIAKNKDCILYDSAVHASTFEGIKLSSASAFPFRHNDLEHLESRLQKRKSPNCFICIESIYSTDGSIAPLKEIYLLSLKYNAYLIVDEAHAIGVTGPLGRGLVAENHLNGKIFAQINTFGKAMGNQGAIVMGSEQLINVLINFCKPFIYTTALPYYALSAIDCSYHFIPKMQKERIHITELIGICKQYLPDSSQTHIQFFQIKGAKNLKEKVKLLNLSGFNVGGLMSPTVQRGHELLRISLHSYNSKEQLVELLKRINEF